MNRPWRCLLVILLGGFAFALSGCQMAAHWDNLRGREAFETGNYNAALGHFQTALNRNSTDASAYYNLGATYHALAKQTKNPQLYTNAEQLYGRSIALDSRYSDAHRGLAVLLCETGRTDAGFDLVRTWQARNPASAEPYVELARLYQEHGDRNQAVQNLTNALAVDAQNARALTAMAMIREQNGEPQLALDNYMRAYQNSVNQPAVAARIAQLQQQLRLPPTNPATTTPDRWGAANPYVPR